jgi:hypothetical protein
VLVKKMAVDMTTGPALFRPDRLSQPYAWIEHIPFAFWIVAQHQPRVLVELGTHTGNSYLAFCQAVARFGLSTRRGIILMHDTNVRTNDFGVFRLWEEVRSQFPHFEFLHGYGLGVLGVVPKVGAQLKALFAASLNGESYRPVRDTFAQRGRSFAVQEAPNE